MSLELLIGPMFAGKSSAIQSIIRRHRALGWNVFVITHSIDTRYSDEPAIVNHDRVSMPAFSTNSLMSVLENAEFKASRLVVIEEAQFFTDLVPFVLQTIDKLSKYVVVVGLDGDAERRPFGHVLELIPHCDRVTKLTAMCKECRDGTPAIFTFAAREDAVVAANDGRPCVGADEKYVPLCRKHFNRAHSPAIAAQNEINLDVHAC
jgi:thymidine kinase